MNEAKIDQAKKAFLEINTFIKQLDESVRSEALRVIVPLYFPRQLQSLPKGQQDVVEVEENEPVDTSDLGNFMAQFPQAKPAENVLLLAAWLYSQYGTSAISARKIEELGNASGLTIPNRPDTTMRQAKREGKALFTQKGKGWSLTVSGELFMKSTYKVKKGTKTLPVD